MRRALCALLGASLLILASNARGQSPDPVLQELLELVEIGGLRNGLALAPDGQSAAIFRRFTELQSDAYRYELVLIDVARPGRVEVLADGGGWVHAPGRPSGAALDRVPRWSPDGRSLAFIAERQGEVQLWRADLTSGVTEPLVSGPGDVGNFTFSADGAALIYEMGRDRDAIAESAIHDETFGFHVDDAFQAAFGLRPLPNRLASAGLWRLDLATRDITPADADDARLIGQATSGVSAARAAPLRSGDTAELRPLVVIAEGLEGDIRCEDPRCIGRIAGVWRTGDTIAFLRMEDRTLSTSALYVWNIRTNQVRSIRRAEERLMDCALTSRELICLHEATLQPRQIAGIDLRTGRMRAIYDPNPGWRRRWIPRFERLDVTDVYGNAAFAHVFYPANYRRGRRYPAIIVQYRSRGFLRGGTGGEYPIHALTARGYVVISADRPEPRTLASELDAGEVERRTELDHSERIMKLSAIEETLDELDRRGLIDPSRIGITGLSDGSETLYWALTHSDRFAAAVSSTPPIDPISWFAGSENFRRARREEFSFTGPWRDAVGEWAQWWRQTPPIERAGFITPPLLMQLADAEALPALPLFARLREDERPVELYLYPGEYHLKWRPRHILAAQQRALDWLDFWLQGVERADAAEPLRLERWRAMRARRAETMR